MRNPAPKARRLRLLQGNERAYDRRRIRESRLPSGQAQYGRFRETSSHTEPVDQAESLFALISSTAPGGGTRAAPHVEHTFACGLFSAPQARHVPYGFVPFLSPLHLPQPVHKYPHIYTFSHFRTKSYGQPIGRTANECRFCIPYPCAHVRKIVFSD